MLTKDNNVIEEDAGGRLKASDVCWRCDFAARPDDSKQWEYVCCNPDCDADYVQYNDCCE